MGGWVWGVTETVGMDLHILDWTFSQVHFLSNIRIQDDQYNQVLMI